MNEMFDYMDKYFNDVLTPSEKEVFEERCLSDTVFAREVAMYITINDHLKFQLHKQQMQELDVVENEANVSDNHFVEYNGETLIPLPLNENGENSLPGGIRGGEDIRKLNSSITEVFKLKNSKRNRLKLFLKFTNAAAIAGVVALTVTWYFNNKNPGIEPIVKSTNSPVQNTPPNDIARPKENKITPLPDNRIELTQAKLQVQDKKKSYALYTKSFERDSLPEQPSGNLEEGDNSYEEGDYVGAIAFYSKAINTIEDPETQSKGSEEQSKRNLFYAYYYKSQSYMALDSVKKAIPVLNKAFKTVPDKHWKGRVQWYLALAYLKTGESEKLNKSLNELASNLQAGKYRSSAIKLMRFLANGK